ncbi:hypothetical protein [Parafrankia soli]|uniref:hypothetical protein n=1 Tax=Parafrankia soli TaxID=2599596 RepID=UPI001F5273B5|nr:hypothetical protein [Parafrankia soli]
MGFFEDVPQPVPAALLPVSLTASLTGPVRAPWLAPPDHQLGGVVAAPPSLGATGDTAVSIGGVVAYPSGVEITLEVRLRPGTAAGADPRLSVAWAREAQRMVRFGVVLPGGARVIAADPGVPLAARLDATVDGSALRAAAERAVTLWPAGDGLDEPGTPPVDVPTEAARVRAAFRSRSWCREPRWAGSPSAPRCSSPGTGR